jgi:predicted FMN-binding regulatory protein PaiB
MKEYPAFAATVDQVGDLLSSQRLVRLVTIDPEGIPRIGVHVFVHDGLTVELHLVQDDPQLDDIRRGSPAVIEADEVLATAPSHWMDPVDATHADQFYRCASLWGTTETTADPEAIAAHLRGIMGRYQPEGHHAPVVAGDAMYRRPIERLSVVRVQGASVRSKFKLAQRTNRESRRQILEGLVRRGGEVDQRTAELIDEAGR